MSHYAHYVTTHTKQWSIFLFECNKLQDLREKFLPQKPDIENTLFGNADQLGMTSEFFVMANRRRAYAHVQAG